MMEEYDGVFDYEFTVDCYRVKWWSTWAEELTTWRLIFKLARTKLLNIDQEILEEMSEWWLYEQ